MDFELYFRQLKTGLNVNETCFCFEGDETEHYIGFLSKYEKPYWAGLCDIKNGCEFNTAEELVNAPIYSGKSLLERWNEGVICTIEGLDLEVWLSELKHC